jgi:hypothetical protein
VMRCTKQKHQYIRSNNESKCHWCGRVRTHKSRGFMWYKLEKFFRGGSDTYQIRVPDSVQLSEDDWDAILEWVGENTDGGHSAGYRIRRHRLRFKSPTIKVLSCPADICAAMMGRGRKVVSVQWVI